MAPSLSKNALDVMGVIDGHNSATSITLQGTEFLANGHPILTDVPPNIVATPSPFMSSAAHEGGGGDKIIKNITVGCFVGFDFPMPNSRHVASLGKLRGIRFMSIFRFKVWWTTHWVGSNGGDVETETQMMILDKNEDGSRPYVLILPILEGSFRASLQAGRDDHVDVCVESGSTRVESSSFRSCVYMHVGDNPYGLVNEAMRVINVHLGTFRLMSEKTPPRIVDKFGWCTWDAFYLKVHPKGVLEGVRRLSDGGTPPGMVLIDDGWQSIAHDEDEIGSLDDQEEGMNRTAAGAQMPCRLTRYEENHKFRDYVSVAHGKGMGGLVRELKEEFKTVEEVYVWHALCGYWGGIRPGAPGMPESSVVRPRLSKGLEMTMEDLAVDKIVSSGVGLVPPEMAHHMYEGLHSHLESVGVDGVKVDVIQLLEMLSEDYGGVIELEKSYYKALTASVKKHFKGNGVIASMEHCNDFMLLGTEAIALGRVGDDFWCIDPSGDPNGTFWLQGCHMVHCAYNSLWMGNFIHPDWDMFQSNHPCAEFHAASRAISGGPIYVSDSVGNHNFKLLKSLALPDGSILRCQHYALPTRDCLFEDPLHDGKTMLKIWNLNKYTGVLGLFNCQGGGWCSQSRRNKSASQFSLLLTCLASPKDVEWEAGRTPVPNIEGVNVFAVYSFQGKKLKLLKSTESIEVSLEPFCFELLTISPVMVLPTKLVQFATIGFINMLNTGGAIQSLEVVDDENKVKIGVRGSGEMKLFTSEKPVGCKIDGVSVKFSYEDKMVSVQVPWPDSSSDFVVEYLF